MKLYIILKTITIIYLFIMIRSLEILANSALYFVFPLYI